MNENWCNHSELAILQEIYFRAHDQAGNDDDEDEGGGRFQRRSRDTCMNIFAREKREQMLNDSRRIQKRLYKIIVLMHTSCLFTGSLWLSHTFSPLGISLSILKFAFF